jgi:hypothetical protein
MMPILLTHYYGGFEGVVPEGCQNELIEDDAEGNPLARGCLAYTRPDLLVYPAQLTTLRALSFVLNNNAYIVNPQILQRLYAASSDTILRKAQLIFQPIYFLIIIPSVLVGITAASIPEVADQIAVTGRPDQAFGLITDVLIDKGGFAMFVSWVLLAGSIAAIMSTTGAAVMGISNTIAVDGYNVVRPNASGSSTVTCAKLCSLATYIIAFIWATDDPENISELAALQFGLLAQVFPVLLLGLYKKRVLQFSVLMGIAAGLFALALTDTSVKVDEQYLEPGLWASIVNSFVVIVVEGAWMLRPNLFPAWILNSDWLGEATGQPIADTTDLYQEQVKMVPGESFTSNTSSRQTPLKISRLSVAESEAGSHMEERDSFLEAMHHLDYHPTPVKDLEHSLLVKSPLATPVVDRGGAGVPDKNIYGTLNSNEIDIIMADTVEPVHTKYALLLPFIFFLQIFALPFWKEGGSEEPLVGGMPEWAIVSLMIYTVIAFCIFLVFKSWVPPPDAAARFEDRGVPTVTQAVVVSYDHE